MVRLGRYPLRTTACRPSAVLMSAYWLKRPSSSVSTARAIRSRAPCRISSCSGSLLVISGCERACRLDLDMAYHSSVGCDRRGDQPTGYATPSACFHTPEITITQKKQITNKPKRYGMTIDSEFHFSPERRTIREIDKITSTSLKDAISKNRSILQNSLIVNDDKGADYYDSVS